MTSWLLEYSSLALPDKRGVQHGIEMSTTADLDMEISLAASLLLAWPWTTGKLKSRYLFFFIFIFIFIFIRNLAQFHDYIPRRVLVVLWCQVLRSLFCDLDIPLGTSSTAPHFQPQNYEWNARFHLQHVFRRVDQQTHCYPALDPISNYLDLQARASNPQATILLLPTASRPRITE